LIYQEKVRVNYNREIAKGYLEVEFESEIIGLHSRPGQFINILPNLNWNNVMRRPMSISQQSNSSLRIIFKIVGTGTAIMSNWKEGELVDIIGPLGNYWKNWKKYHPVLIGGGVGIAPILNLHYHLNAMKINNTLIMGARNKYEHFLKHSPKNRIYLTTDDGSYGISGNVLDAYNFINNKDKQKIFSCGPVSMMMGVRKMAIEKDIPCDLAIERIMACGFGICQGCTVERLSSLDEHSYRNRFALACIDGPIFSAKEIISC